MNFNYVVTSQDLLKSQINYTITILSKRCGKVLAMIQ
jgi:hypothetical protein